MKINISQANHWLNLILNLNEQIQLVLKLIDNGHYEFKRNYSLFII